MFKLIYKKINQSSFQAIKEFQKKNNIKKIGHTGTLDPLAQGLLLVATDDDTKLIPFIKNKDKEYLVKLKLGFISKTYDAEGPISFCSDYVPTLEEVKKCISLFIGDIKQTPPSFSAKKINGKKAYELARKNQEVILQEINITIHSINLIKYEYPFIEFSANVSNGTYIRSLVNNIGQKLKTGAYMSFLERTKVNGFSINDQITTDTLFDFNVIDIDIINLKDLFNGKSVNKLNNLPNGKYSITYNKDIVGILIFENNKKVLQKLFGNKIVKILF